MTSAGVPHPEERPEAASRRTHGPYPSHILPVRVYYEDTDAAGMVYHANYLRFAERGRSEMLRSMGFPHRKLGAEEGVGFAVRRCAIEFLAPARLEDALTVLTTLAGVGAATLSLNQQIRRDDALIADMDVVVACIGRDGRPRRLPAALRAALSQSQAVARSSDEAVTARAP